MTERSFCVSRSLNHKTFEQIFVSLLVDQFHLKQLYVELKTMQIVIKLLFIFSISLNSLISFVFSKDINLSNKTKIHNRFYTFFKCFVVYSNLVVQLVLPLYNFLSLLVLVLMSDLIVKQ